MTEPEKNWEYYKKIVQERGIILKYPGDCGCEYCQITYAWIEDGAPGLGEWQSKIMRVPKT